MSSIRNSEPLKDDPLWYDRIEPDVPPGRLLLLLADAVSALSDLYVGSKRFLHRILD